jgi:hypothetical protein
MQVFMIKIDWNIIWQDHHLKYKLMDKQTIQTFSKFLTKLKSIKKESECQFLCDVINFYLSFTLFELFASEKYYSFFSIQFSHNIK